jgi:hypothetical protein
MEKFISLWFSRLPNAAHYNFFTNMKATIDAAPQDVTDVLGDNIPAFVTLLAEERDHMDWINKNTLTQEIEEADQAMDAALTALRTTVRGMRTFSVASISTAAKRIYTMLMDYGTVTKKPYEEQSGDVKTILAQISEGGRYYDDISVLKKAASVVGGMIVDLQNAFNNFTSLLAQRDAQSLEKPKRPFPDVRRDIEAVYRKMVNIIDAHAAVGTSPAFDDFIKSLNPEIERLNAEFHRARKDLGVGDHTVIEPIDTQPYVEGRPSTPVPVVHYCEGDEKPTVQLFLGRDFSVTYRNNDNVGMANLTIHGQGKYKGAKITTFMIAR